MTLTASSGVKSTAIITPTITMSHTANTDALSITQTGADSAIYINQDGNANAFHLDSGVTTGLGLYVDQTGVLSSSASAMFSSDAVQNDGASYMVYITMNSASSTIPLLKLNTGGTGTQILGDGNENLSSAGVWTDRTSFFIDKANYALIPLDNSYIDKLRNTNIYTYQKKCEIEAKIQRENDFKEKEYPDSKTYVGIILDDPTTPEELISRDIEGNISGISGAQLANFSLAVGKELIKKIDELENRIKILEEKK
jgi:hypothetical protein